MNAELKLNTMILSPSQRICCQVDNSRGLLEILGIPFMSRPISLHHTVPVAFKWRQSYDQNELSGIDCALPY